VERAAISVPADLPADGPRRVVIDAIRPAVDGGRYPVKRTVGDRMWVEADILIDGHDRLAAVLLYRRRGESVWRETALQPVGATPGQADDDVWRGEFLVDALGTWEYTVSAWVDGWATWGWGLRRKLEAGQGIELELREGSALAEAASVRAAAAGNPGQATELQRLARDLAGNGAASDSDSARARAAIGLEASADALLRAHADRARATTQDPPLPLTVDPIRARFSSWYELFPRSTGAGGQHGTFRDAEARLGYIAEMGFDVVYLPPIHPIGHTHRKGPDNRLHAEPGDPGSPWAIGGAEGGHRAIHPALGTLDDFHHFVDAARQHGLQVALDIAFQTSPDHPYVAAHPEWFVHRADGSVQYAENPPKKYQDIYPFAFAGAGWEDLWQELRGVFLHWIAQGITIFRVDNPHTKPIPFWRWCIQTIKERHPEVIFLAEAFTRPKIMYALAKVGFSQSYTYFTWRTTKEEITRYLRSLTDSPVKEYFRPNFWPNTPDILPEHLQLGTRATFIARAVLAATLSPSWGIYGPAYELQERVAREGAEEYAGNEKYQLREWDLGRTDNLRPVLRRLNQIRRDSPELQQLAGTVFHDTDNPQLICYSRGSALLVVVNLDPHHRQEGWLSLDAAAVGLRADTRFQVHDLVGDARYLWDGPRAFVSLDPAVMPAQIFRLHQLVRSERTFEYYL
jgi:starch synthase (maltosyl-transferring)